MKATKKIVEKRVVEALSATPIKEFTVDKSLEAYALYNALVGTTFDAESYKTLVEDEVGVQYLYDHIPGGAKLVKVDTTPSTNDTKNPDGQTKNSEENKDESDENTDSMDGDEFEPAQKNAKSSEIEVGGTTPFTDDAKNTDEQTGESTEKKDESDGNTNSMD